MARKKLETLLSRGPPELKTVFGDLQAGLASLGLDERRLMESITFRLPNKKKPAFANIGPSQETNEVMVELYVSSAFRSDIVNAFHQAVGKLGLQTRGTTNPTIHVPPNEGHKVPRLIELMKEHFPLAVSQ